MTDEELIAGLRRLADVLEAGERGGFALGREAAARLASIARLEAEVTGAEEWIAFYRNRFDLEVWLQRKNAWSERTFGPGERTTALLAHIRKELDEIAANPTDIVEWIDVVFLATEGAYRVGASPADIIQALEAKLVKNINRPWPDWRTSPRDQPIEHVRSFDGPRWTSRA